MERDPGDIIDRASIAYLKSKRIGDADSNKEWLIFLGGLSELEEKFADKLDVSKYFDKILAINTKIWDLESAIRKGKLDNNIMEVGRRAIEIREWNGKRIEVKNKFNKLTNAGTAEQKKDHISA